MSSEIQFLAVGGSLVVLLLVLQLIRQRRLREKYALLWLACSMVLLVFSLWRELLHRVAHLAGVAYPPTVLLLGAILIGFLLAMHYSISLSRLEEQNKRLAQELALLRQRMERSEGRSQASTGD